MTKISCPSCAARYNVPDGRLGKRVKCAKCGNQFQLTPPPRASVPVAREPAHDEFGFPELAALQTRQAIAPPPAPVAVATSAAAARRPFASAGQSPLVNYLADVLGFARILTQPWELLTLAIVCGICMFQVIAGYAGCLGLAAKVIITGWYLSFLLKTVQGGAARDDGLPNFSLTDGVMEDIILPCLSFVSVRIVAALPLVGALVFAASDSRIPSDVASILAFLGIAMPELALLTSLLLAEQMPALITTVAPALLVGMAAVPMLVLVVAIAGIGSLARVDLMLATIARTGPGYAAATLIYLGSLVVVGGVGYVVEEAISQGSPAAKPAPAPTATPPATPPPIPTSSPGAPLGTPPAADPDADEDPNAAAAGAPPNAGMGAGFAVRRSPPNMAKLTGSLVGQLVATLIGVITSIFAMRAIGLYYAHFKHNFAWSWE